MEPVMPTINPQIRAAMAQKETQDTLIMQKVNQHHREAFRERFPGQIEHALRLTAERLQACLNKPAGFEAGDPLTWPASADDILCLARALESLYGIYREQHDPASL
jgi:hypothetical protein